MFIVLFNAFILFLFKVFLGFSVFRHLANGHRQPSRSGTGIQLALLDMPGINPQPYSTGTGIYKRFTSQLLLVYRPQDKDMANAFLGVYKLDEGFENVFLGFVFGQWYRKMGPAHLFLPDVGNVSCPIPVTE